MRIAVSLGGTDYGQSGIGVYTRAIIPRIFRAIADGEDDIVVMGTRKESAAYEDVLVDIPRIELPSVFDSAGGNALFHFLAAGPVLTRAGISVALFPAANRRMPAYSPIPTVAVVHDLAQLHVKRKYDPLRMLYFRRALLPALRRASRVVAISSATKNDLLQALNWPPSRIALVPNGVDAARFTPPTERDERIRRAREVLGIQSPYVLYLSRLEHPGKNHLRLVKAFASSSIAARHSLVLAGADWGARSRIRETAEQLRVERRVHLPGFVVDDLTPGLLAGADAVAMVGLREGFGLPALEALAAGRPLFVSNTGALPEVTGDLASCCDPLDSESIQFAMDKALSDTSFRRRALLEGPQWAQRYDWDHTARSLLSLCRQVVREEKIRLQ